MPLKSLSKVTKKIKAKKGGKLDSLGLRDAKRLNRAALRDQKLKKDGANKAKVRKVNMVRVGYFKVATKDVTEPLSIPEVRSLIEKWVHRDDQELAEIQAQRRPGRPSSTKEDALKNKIDKEMDEFRTGFYVPDLQDWKNIENLQKWDGGLGSLAQVKFMRIAQDPGSTETEMQM